MSLFRFFIIRDETLHHPLGQSLAVRTDYKTALVKSVLDISQFHEYGSGRSVGQHIEIACADSSGKPTVGLVLVIFRFESFLHGLSQTLAVGLVFGVVKEYIGLMALATAVHMKKNGTAVFIVLTVLLVKLIDFGTTLLQFKKSIIK